VLQHCNHVIHVCFKVKADHLLIYTIKNYMTPLSLPLAVLRSIAIKLSV
jgi:hypothetical protein